VPCRHEGDEAHGDQENDAAGKLLEITATRLAPVHERLLRLAMKRASRYPFVASTRRGPGLAGRVVWAGAVDTGSRPRRTLREELGLPVSATAPGPGRSAAASTVLLYDGGCRRRSPGSRRAASVCQAGGLRACLRDGPGGTPLGANAPELRCRQLVLGAAVQSLSAVSSRGIRSRACPSQLRGPTSPARTTPSKTLKREDG